MDALEELAILDRSRAIVHTKNLTILLYDPEAAVILFKHQAVMHHRR